MKIGKKKQSSQMRGAVNKKILTVICVVIIVIILIPVVLSRNSQSVQQPRKNTTVHADVSTNTHVAYQNDFYSLSYPSTWTKSEKELANDQGSVVTFLPQGANSGQYVTVSIEVLNGQQTSIVSLTNLFRTLKYTETTSTVAGIFAQKYTAILPTQDGSLHSIVYLFQQNEKVYSIKFEYIQPSTNMQLEGQFDQMMNSFSPK